MSSLLTQAVVTQYVKTSLGSPIIEVEITDEQIELMTDKALSVYGSKKPIERIFTFPSVPSQQLYTFTTSQVGRGIVAVATPDLLRQPISLDQFDVFKYHANLPNLDPGDFYMEKVWWNEVRMSAGSEDDWEAVYHYDTDTIDLYLNPIPSQSQTVCVWYVDNPTLRTVPKHDDDWLKDYALALCKNVVGRIRSKFKEVSGAEGAIELDGDTLLTEAKEEKEKLEEYLNKKGQTVPPIRG
jgi:hypothetical protein